MLCGCCQKIHIPHLSYAPKKEGGSQAAHQCIVRHHEDFAALLKSADDGCELCSLFRPFIEHAQLRRQDAVDATASDCTDSDGSGFTWEDPFLTESVLSTDSDIESGSGPATDYANSEKEPSEFDPEPEEANNLESEVDSEVDSESSSVVAAKKNGEILRWLLLNKTHATGPEQLWVTGHWTYKDKNNFTQSKDAVSMISLSAGSIAGHRISFDDSCYCLDSEWFETRQSLAIKAPGLWKWHYDPLKIRAGRKRPLRALRPNFELFQQRGQTRELDPSIPGRNIVEDPISEEAIAVVQDWLGECRFSHAACPTAWENEVQLPSRVIDVCSPGEALQPHLYQTTSNLGPKGDRYAILSHCWGPDVSAITRTVRTNLEGMQRGIDMTTLSRNFKDAILITRGLKIRYLWIDALCIIQDSKEDWAQESGQMAKYYRNASITISGLASPGASHGILLPRLADKLAAPLSHFKGAVFVRPILDDTVSIMGEDLCASDDRPQVVSMPLFRRAWTLQERVLSKRMVHYAEQQMVWQCRACLLSEDGQYSSIEETRTTGKLVDLLNIDPQSKVVTPARLKWHKLMCEYTRRHLTYDSDKLPAMSALASETARLSGDKYLAGLWKGTIRAELLWETDTDGESLPNHCRINNGSPTWSWASIKGKVINSAPRSNRVPRDYDPRFREVTVDPATSDPFGEVKGGKIVLSAFCHTYVGLKTFIPKGTVSRSKDESACSDTDSDSEPRGWHQFHKLDVPNEKYDWASDPHIIACMGEYSDDWKGAKTDMQDSTNKYGYQEFLLLKGVKPNETSIYQRVGRASSQLIDKRLPIIESKGWSRRTITLV